MITPERIAPISPEDKINISAKANDKILLPKAEKDAPGFWKYSINLTLSIIKIQTIGYTIAIIQDMRKSIFNKNPIPKNKTKNNSIDISKTGKLNMSITSITPF